MEGDARKLEKCIHGGATLYISEIKGDDSSFWFETAGMVVIPPSTLNGNGFCSVVSSMELQVFYGFLSS